MPNSNTFQIKPINEIIKKYSFGKIIDPFANSNKLATITNDIDEQYDTNYHLDATDFLKIFPNESVDTVLYDPPYSPRQVAECYKRLGRAVNMATTQASYWSKQKAEIARIVMCRLRCIFIARSRVRNIKQFVGAWFLIVMSCLGCRQVKSSTAVAWK